jgi:NAD(P)H-hydrate epimerase
VLTAQNLHENCVVTPHAEEFESIFKCVATPQNVLKMAKQFRCTVVLKGGSDYISNGNLIYENQTGNAGMTKGGTGDVLAGLIGGLCAKNDILTAAAAGAYLNGLAGDRLYETKSTFYNAEDVISELGKIWGEYLK